MTRPLTEADLLPCPFCRSRAELGGFESSWYIACTNEDCWAHIHGSLWADREEAIAAWNRRTESPEVERLRERVRVLEEALEPFAKAFDIATHAADGARSRLVLSDYAALMARHVCHGDFRRAALARTPKESCSLMEVL